MDDAMMDFESANICECIVIVPTYCDISTWFIARQWLGKHVFTVTDIQTAMQELLEFVFSV
jgi:hypothetical protein